jgi:hypothetical protein
VARFLFVDVFLVDGVVALVGLGVGELVRERAVVRFVAGDVALAGLLCDLGGAASRFGLLAMASLTTRDMRRATGLARGEVLVWMDGLAVNVGGSEAFGSTVTGLDS